MSTFVKICGLTHAADVAAAVAAGADAIGFVFAESPRRVTPEQAAELGRAVPDGVLRVAVMLHPTQAEWQTVADVFEPDVLQTDAGDFATLSVADGVERWPVCREGRDDPVDDGRFVYEGGKSGQGETVDWERAAAVARGRRMILAGGLGPANVRTAIRAVRPYGVDASSSLESSPGRKDGTLMARFVAAARNTELD